MIVYFFFRVKEGRALVQVAKPLCLTDTNQKDAQPAIFTLEESTSHSPNNPNLMHQFFERYLGRENFAKNFKSVFSNSN